MNEATYKKIRVSSTQSPEHSTGSCSECQDVVNSRKNKKLCNHMLRHPYSLMSVTEVSVLSLPVLISCLALLYAQQKILNLEIFPDGLMAEEESLKFWHHFVTRSKWVLTGMLPIILPYWHRPSSWQKLRAQQETSGYHYICKMPHIRILIFSGPSVCYPCGIRRISITENHTTAV